MIRKAGDRSGWKVKIMLYGASDTGKTYTTSRLTEAYRTLILDIEGGSVSAPPNLAYCEYADYKEVLHPDNAEKYPSAMMRIASYEEAEKMLGHLRRLPGRYDIIVIDSATELQRRCADYVKTKGTTVVPDLDTLSLQGWGSLGEKYRTMIRGYRDLDCHIVFTALEQCMSNKESGFVRWMPLVEGRKTPFEMVGWMEVVGHAVKMEKKDKNGKMTVERVFRFHSNGRDEAKVRGGLLDDEMPADLVQVFQKLLLIETVPSVETQDCANI